ncbi:MAG: molybdate ABC transporter permease subunit [Anaerolineae bacterium]|nr:molybdate ABC transporter permease subunit [Anaerolineae bacterium]
MAQSPLYWSQRPKVVTTTKWPEKLLQLLSLPLLMFIFLPMAALFLRTPPERLWANLGSPQVMQAISLSFGTTCITVVIAIILGTPVGYLLARYDFRMRRLFDTLLDLPLVLPPAVAGVSLLMAFGRRGLLGGYLEALGIDIAFTQCAVILAQTFVAAPFYVKAAILGFSTIEPELEQAAALDGASHRQVFQFITIPLSWTALLSGMVMTWARALGEFGATIIFAGNYPGRTQTMPLAIYLGFELDLDVALTLAVILVGLSFMILMVVKGFLHHEIRQG